MSQCRPASPLGRESNACRQWVPVHDAPWNCAELIQAGHTFFAAHIEGFDVVARYEHVVVCGEVAQRPLEGVIERVEKEDLSGSSSTG